MFAQPLRGRTRPAGNVDATGLSVTRLQKTIETFSLYPEERKRLAREDVIGLMRSKINVSMVTGSTPGLWRHFVSPIAEGIRGSSRR